MKLSAIVITKNAAGKIKDCLTSLKFADEVIVVDSGSTDKTKELALNAGAKIVDVKSIGYSHSRNSGAQKAKGEWLLYIDSDERVTNKLSETILKKSNASTHQHINSFRIYRQNIILGKWLKHGGWWPAPAAYRFGDIDGPEASRYPGDHGLGDRALCENAALAACRVRAARGPRRVRRRAPRAARRRARRPGAPGQLARRDRHADRSGARLSVRRGVASASARAARARRGFGARARRGDRSRRAARLRPRAPLDGRPRRRGCRFELEA